MTFTVASYNILATAYIRKKFYPRTPDDVLAPTARIPALVRHVAQLDADIMCLQEVEGETFTALQAGLSTHSGHFARKDGDRPDGCATFVRTGIATSGSVERLNYADGSGAEPASGHVALIVRVAQAGRVLGIANTHLKWSPPDTARTDHRGVRQVEQLLSVLDALPACDAWIICGDLNVEPDSEVIATLRRAGFRSTYDDPEAYTCNPNGSAKVIDYLCHDGGLRSFPHKLPAIDDRTVLPSREQPSDHLAIMASF